MGKWNRYRRIQLVDVLLFERPVDPGNPIYPIQIDPCRCEPQDGYTCGQHQRNPQYSYHYRAIDRMVSIRPGEYLVLFSNGQAMTVTAEELGQHYEGA